MERNRRGSLAVAVLLILSGLWFLGVQLAPGLAARVYGPYGWPLLIVGAGVALLVIGLATGATGMAVPACIVGGIGGLLYWQNATGNWETWAYAWALIPGFVGVGTILMGLLERRMSAIWSGGWLIVISLALFAVFGSFLGGMTLFGPYWPVLLIALGLLALGRAVVRAR